jgi:serine/threonine protein kinase
MNTQIEDLILHKCLGKGSFGEVFLSSKKGRNELFATKKMSRAQVDKPSLKKYFENEIKLLIYLRHPNIVKFEEIKKTKDYYYIVMEYINGGSLSDCLNKYKAKTGKAFPEEIVQYLMKQIVETIKFIHSKKVIHRDLKLDNIMVSFDNENDKNSLNMMKAKIKIIDFGFAIHLTKSLLAFSALGSPINMDPLILKKYSSKGKDINKLGYDFKADIWSLGTICYEMLIGQAVFNAETMNDLVRKVENGSYVIPTSVSKEVVSFLNGMLQYNSENRLTSEELAMHPFLTKRIKEFTKIDTKRASKKIDNRGLNINVKANQTIWAIFNEEDEKKLVNIKGGRDMPAPEGPISEDYNVRNKRAQTEKHIPRMKINNNNNINQQNNRNIPNNNNQYNNINNNNQIKNYPTFDNSFYGHNMYPNFNIILNQQGGKQPEMYQNPGVQQQRIQQIPGSYQISRQQMAGMGYTSNMSNYQGFGVPMAYSYGGMYQNSNIRVPYPPGYMPNKANNYPKQYSFYNDLDEDDRNLGCCII